MNYTYNIRGWLTQINDITDLSQEPGLFADLFSFKINYNTVDESLGNQVKELYNGNIAETFWITSNDNELRKYGYAYDKLNRLTDAFYQRPNSSNPSPGNYNEHLQFDKNGNILGLERNGEHDDIEAPLLIDELQYFYEGNQLTKVIDRSLNPNGFKDSTMNEVPDYGYDGFGNMIHDENKGILEITYNHLNLPITIDFGEGKYIHYLYNAQGRKVSKTVEAVVTHQTTLYDNGFQYVDGNLEFFPHAEGYVRVTDGSRFNYVYNYTDHLGNIRLSYGLDPRNNVLTIMEENHYYPFGLKHKNYNMDLKDYQIYLEEQIQIGEILIGDGVYKYKYNGKEWQDELGLDVYDYDNRVYEPAYGRFWQTDPLAEQGRRWSPYNYVFNNPIYFQDPDGMWPKPSYPSWESVKAKAKETLTSLKEKASYQKAKIKSDLSKAGEKTGFAKAGRWFNELGVSISNGVDFKVDNPENVNEGISKKGKGSRDTPIVKIDVMKDLLNVHGPDTNLPGTDLTNANPEGSSLSTSSTSTMETTVNADSETVNVERKSYRSTNVLGGGRAALSTVNVDKKKDTTVLKKDVNKIKALNTKDSIKEANNSKIKNAQYGY